VISASALTVGYGDREVLHEVDVPLPAGRITAIVGANASGKSTLLRAFARLLKPSGGAVLLDGAEITSLPTRDVARRLGFLPQSPVPPEGLTVADLVQRGRFPHQRLGRRASAEDRERVEWALSATGIADLRDRALDRLSGGQRQRVWIAMALAQDTPILLLDEPTTYLDLAHQLEVLDLLADLNAAGRTIGIVLHDLNHACRYAHHLVALRDGVVHAAGPPGEIVDEALVEAVFGLKSRVIPDPVTGTPMCVPIGRTVAQVAGLSAPTRNHTRESSSATPQASARRSTK
jgi:iron complex transport system ATP-binding protein